MTKNEPLVFILILNFCSLEDAKECVNSVRKNNYQNIQILVIDNASPDGSGQQLKTQLPEKEFLQLPKNTGYAGGNNIGIDIALKKGADYIFILNPDIRLLPDAIETYVNIMDNDKSIFALNPLQLTADNVLDAKFANEMFTNNGYPFPSLSTGDNKFWQVKTLFGASLFLSRTAIEKTGGFDPLFFAYWEEIDLCRRLKKNGGKLIVTQQAPVIHLRTKEKSKKPDDFILFLRLKGMYLYKLKNHELSFFNSLYEITRECFRYLIIDFKGMFSWKKTHFIKALCWIYFYLPKIVMHRYLEKKQGCLYLPRLR